MTDFGTGAGSFDFLSMPNLAQHKDSLLPEVLGPRPAADVLFDEFPWNQPQTQLQQPQQPQQQHPPPQTHKHSRSNSGQHTFSVSEDNHVAVQTRGSVGSTSSFGSDSRTPSHSLRVGRNRSQSVTDEHHLPRNFSFLGVGAIKEEPLDQAGEEHVSTPYSTNSPEPAGGSLPSSPPASVGSHHSHGGYSQGNHSHDSHGSEGPGRSSPMSVQDQMAQLRRENERLQAENARLRSEKEGQLHEALGLQQEKRELAAEVHRLQTQISRLHSQMSTLMIHRNAAGGFVQHDLPMMPSLEHNDSTQNAASSGSEGERAADPRWTQQQQQQQQHAQAAAAAAVAVAAMAQRQPHQNGAQPMQMNRNGVEEELFANVPNFPSLSITSPAHDRVARAYQPVRHERSRSMSSRSNSIDASPYARMIPTGARGTRIMFPGGPGTPGSNSRLEAAPYPMHRRRMSATLPVVHGFHSENQSPAISPQQADAKPPKPPKTERVQEDMMEIPFEIPEDLKPVFEARLGPNVRFSYCLHSTGKKYVHAGTLASLLGYKNPSNMPLIQRSKASPDRRHPEAIKFYFQRRGCQCAQLSWYLPVYAVAQLVGMFKNSNKKLMTATPERKKEYARICETLLNLTQTPEFAPVQAVP